ncbi:hypothetical protein [Oerskovia sp. KBS0722]|uniref:hypothetical protein n=1 Tax=Oerskovia sp. KBS0722 TaxID=1179673 RepID=UPI0011A34630|nr:hypothetical protein [Oerskovia sp. KBS0722]QDW64335.1 hypothetical protein FFI11_019095 [Oerskovia sp. KBS0722]
MTTAVSVSVIGLVPAAAAADPVELTADLIAKVAPDQGEVVLGDIAAGGIKATSGDTSITVPIDPKGAVSFDSPDLAAPLEVPLPAELDVAEGSMASDGTIVYEGKEGSAGAAVQVLADGSARFQTITPDVDARHEFSYTFGEGVVPTITEDGLVELVAETDLSAMKVVVGTVDEPWAVDANGAPVSTRYQVEGGALVQTIEAGPSTVYPIVADPRLTAGVGFYLYLNKVEAGAVNTATASIAAVGAGAACAVYGKKVAKIPGMATLVNKLCGFVSATALYSFFTVEIPKLIKSTPNCTELRYFGGWTSKSVSTSLCTPINQSMQWT